MVTRDERRLIKALIRLRIFRVFAHMRMVEIGARWGARWLLKRILKRQAVDDLHHAPCCPANHYCRQRIVFQRCTCGAAYYARQEAEEEKRVAAAKYSVFAKEGA